MYNPETNEVEDEDMYLILDTKTNKYLRCFTTRAEAEAFVIDLPNVKITELLVCE